MIRPITHSINRPLVSRIRFQLLGGLVFAVMLPAVIQHPSEIDFHFQANELNTVIGAVLAIIFGLSASRKLSSFPSVTAGSYIIISFSLAYAMVVAAFFMLRLDYSRYLFLASFVLCLIWFLVIYFMVNRRVKAKLAIVPGGNASELLRIKDIRWTLLAEPKDFKRKHGAIVVDLRHNHDPDWERFIADCALQGIPVFHTKQIQESLTGKVAIEHLSENTLGSLLPNLLYLRVKHILDILLAVLFLPVFAIIYGGVGFLILVSSGRPILFTQKRMGYRGKIFTVYKFRTMITEIESSDLDKRAIAVTQDDDARITPIGSVLRKYRIDEIPQIINILRGEMSWIGPRPEAISLSEWYETELPFYPYRHITKPGISGWAQVNQGHVADVDDVQEKLHYDFFYIKNLSAWLDFLIAVRTLRIMFSGFGSK